MKWNDSVLPAPQRPPQPTSPQEFDPVRFVMMDFKTDDPAKRKKIAEFRSQYLSLYLQVKTFAAKEIALVPIRLKKKHEILKARVRQLEKEKQDITNRKFALEIECNQAKERINHAYNELQAAREARKRLSDYAADADITKAAIAIVNAEEQWEMEKRDLEQPQRDYSNLWDRMQTPEFSEDLEKAKREADECSVELQKAEKLCEELREPKAKAAAPNGGSMGNSSGDSLGIQGFVRV